MLTRFRFGAIKLHSIRLSFLYQRAFATQPVAADRNDATSKFLASVGGTVKGLSQLNYTVEHNPNLTAEQKAKMKQFLIYRYNPADPNDTPKYVSYYIDLNEIKPMYLDALLYIKDNYDSTLSFRRSCREGICGSCSMNCDGLHTLACIKNYDRDLTQPTIMTPLGHMFVLKDLVVDMTNFFTQYKAIVPYLKRKDEKVGNKEYYQSPEDRKKLDLLYECVLCACCQSACPAYWWHPEKYLGPAILQQAYRWVVDSRDQYTDERLELLSEELIADGCENIGLCTVTCPKALDPQKSVQIINKMIEDFKHRKMVNQML